MHSNATAAAVNKTLRAIATPMTIFQVLLIAETLFSSAHVRSKRTAERQRAPKPTYAGAALRLRVPTARSAGAELKRASRPGKPSAAAKGKNCRMQDSYIGKEKTLRRKVLWPKKSLLMRFFPERAFTDGFSRIFRTLQQLHGRRPAEPAYPLRQIIYHTEATLISPRRRFAAARCDRRALTPSGIATAQIIGGHLRARSAAVYRRRLHRSSDGAESNV